MKNTFTKIALLVLSLALLACVPFAVSAEETSNEVKILAKNVIYEDQIRLVFAVDATVEEANNVKVVYKWGEDGEVKNAVLLDPTVSVNLYNDHPAFAIDGVPAKELAATVYVTAFTGDAPADDADWLTYSAAEYFYAKLYKDGFINMTEADGDDYNRKCLYQTQLELGKYAQLVLNYNENQLATDYSYIFTTNESVSFGGKSTAFGYGELSLTATSELAISGWTLTDMNGEETTLETAILTAKGVYSVEPIFGGHDCADENPVDHLCDSCGDPLSSCATNDNNHLCDLCGKVASTCVDADKNGQCDVCFVYNFNVESMAQSEQLNIYNVAWNGQDTTVEDNFSSTTTLTTSQNRPSGFDNGEWFCLAANPTDAADTVLRFNSIYKKDNTEKSHITFAPNVEVENGDLVVFEFDFYHVSGASSKNPIRFYDIYADGTASADYTPTYTNANNVAVSIGTTKPTFAKETWVRYRLVYNNSNDTIYWYYSVDGGATYAFAGTNAYKAASDIVAVGFRGNNVWNGNSTLLFDNIKCVKTTAEAYGITLN